MKPIILAPVYDANGKDVTPFPEYTNGLGRLADCYSCLVTEEINGTYTATAKCHVTSPHSDLIVEGNYLYLQHDSTRDFQPFEIKRVTKKTDGSIEAYCEHLSYKLTRCTVHPFSASSLANAMTNIAIWSVPANSFTFSASFTPETDQEYYLNKPMTARSVLNGVEGSILDVYGQGEWVFDRWTCTLVPARGSVSGVRIRSGHNLSSLTIQSQATDWYKAIYPYYYDANGLLRLAGSGNVVSRNDETDYTTVIPVDVTERFTSFPTAEQVRNAGYSWLKANKPWDNEPTITIKWSSAIDDEGSDVVLGDTVTVQDKTLNYKADHRIVKTVWDCLKERYDSVEVGKLSPTMYNLIWRISREANGKL